MKKAVIVCGSPGAGKTTYGRKQAEALGATFLDIDTVSGRLVTVALTEVGRNPSDRDSDYFKCTYRTAIYETLFDIAQENLRWSDVVIVGPFTRELRERDWLAQLGSRLGCAVEVHHVVCETTERMQRLKVRGCARDEAKLENWIEMNAYYGAEDPPVFEHVRIDTSKVA